MKSFRNLLLMAGMAGVLASCSSSGNDPNTVTVDGNSTVLQSTGVGQSASVGSQYVVAYTNTFTPSTSLYPSVSLMLGDHTYTTYSQADFFAFFTTGSKTFATDPNTAGFTVSYKENSGSDTYSSAFGSQTGSTVTFNSFTNHPTDGFSGDYVSYSVTFNCKVYNTNNTSMSKTISGTFEGHFVQY